MHWIKRNFSTLPLEDELVEVPTGVGFCMYIRRDCLDAVGCHFDEQTFGKGYGEENDWCQRAHKLGWKNYHQLNVFAYHKGVSFQEGDPRKARALELLNALHPNYTRDVMAFIGQDLPTGADDGQDKVCSTKRSFLLCFLSPIILVVVWLSMFPSWPLTISVKPTPSFDPGPARRAHSISISVPWKTIRADAFVFNIHTEYELLVAFLRELGVGRVHFHHVMGLSPRAWLLPSSLGVPYDVLII